MDLATLLSIMQALPAVPSQAEYHCPICHTIQNTLDSRVCPECHRRAIPADHILTTNYIPESEKVNA